MEIDSVVDREIVAQLVEQPFERNRVFLLSILPWDVVRDDFLGRCDRRGRLRNFF